MHPRRLLSSIGRLSKILRVFWIGRVFLKWHAFLKASGVNLQMTIPQAKLVGKWQVFFAICRLFLKRHRIFKAAEFFQSGKVFCTKKLPSEIDRSGLLSSSAEPEASGHQKLRFTVFCKKPKLRQNDLSFCKNTEASRGKLKLRQQKHRSCNFCPSFLTYCEELNY